MPILFYCLFYFSRSALWYTLDRLTMRPSSIIFSPFTSFPTLTPFVFTISTPSIFFFVFFFNPSIAIETLRSRLTSKKGIKLVRDGIPVGARPLAWDCLCGATKDLNANPEYYDTCLLQFTFRPTKSHGDILKDVRRTMQYNPLFRSPEGSGRLANILSAFSFRYVR